MRSKLPGPAGRRSLLCLLVGVVSAVLLVLVVQPLEGSPARARNSNAFVNSIGVNTHIPYDDTVYWNRYPLVKQRLAALGVRHIRDGARRSTYKPYDQTVYRRYRELAGLGIKANLIVDPTKQGLATIEPADMRYIAEKAGPALESVEGPNERDINGGANWAAETRAYQKDLYRTTKSVSRTKAVPVLAPSLAHARNAAALGNLGSALDYGNMHPYAGGLSPAYRYPDGYSPLDHYNIANTKKVSGRARLIATEAGYHNALRDTSSGQPGVSERAAARYMPRMYLEYFNRGIKRTYAYELIDLKPNPGRDDLEKNFGLLRNDGSQKPAYRALKNLIYILKDPGPAFKTSSLSYSLTGQTNGIHRTLLQKRNGSFYLVLWQERPSYDLKAKKNTAVPAKRVRLTLNQPVSRVTTYLPSSSTKVKKRYVAPKRLTLDVPDHPLVVKVTPKPG